MTHPCDLPEFDRMRRIEQEMRDEMRSDAKRKPWQPEIFRKPLATPQPSEQEAVLVICYGPDPDHVSLHLLNDSCENPREPVGHLSAAEAKLARVEKLVGELDNFVTPSPPTNSDFSRGFVAGTKVGVDNVKDRLAAALKGESE